MNKGRCEICLESKETHFWAAEDKFLCDDCFIESEDETVLKELEE